MEKKFAAFLFVLCALGAYSPPLRNGFAWDNDAPVAVAARGALR